MVGVFFVLARYDNKFIRYFQVGLLLLLSFLLIGTNDNHTELSGFVLLSIALAAAYKMTLFGRRTQRVLAIVVVFTLTSTFWAGAAHDFRNDVAHPYALASVERISDNTEIAEKLDRYADRIDHFGKHLPRDQPVGTTVDVSTGSFFRRGRSHRKGGTGLGIINVIRALEILGARMTMENKTSGVCSVIELPLVCCSMAVGSATLPPAPAES